MVVVHKVLKEIYHVYMDFNLAYEDEYVLEKNHRRNQNNNQFAKNYWSRFVQNNKHVLILPIKSANTSFILVT